MCKMDIDQGFLEYISQFLLSKKKSQSTNQTWNRLWKVLTKWNTAGVRKMLLLTLTNEYLNQYLHLHLYPARYKVVFLQGHDRYLSKNILYLHILIYHFQWISGKISSNGGAFWYFFLLQKDSCPYHLSLKCNSPYLGHQNNFHWHKHWNKERICHEILLVQENSILETRK